MNSSFDLARKAAALAASAQNHPAGALYVVGTPIGNLADISLRALHVLDQVDLIACEDTRHSAGMLKQYGISKPLLAVHEHNESQAAAAVVEKLQTGARIAYISDAGTPGISDPGARLVAAARSAGATVIPIPGASSPTALLSVAGVQDGAAVLFVGFLPSKAGEREKAWQGVRQHIGAVVLLEAPHRLDTLAGEIASLGPRRVTLGRELTKQFEEVATLMAAELPSWLDQEPKRRRGEFTVVLHPAAMPQEPGSPHHRILSLLMAHLPLKTAVQLSAEITGAPRNTLYEQALKLQQQGCSE